MSSGLIALLTAEHESLAPHPIAWVKLVARKASQKNPNQPNKQVSIKVSIEGYKYRNKKTGARTSLVKEYGHP